MAQQHSVLVLLRIAAVLFVAVLLGGCPSSSSRTTIEGYSDQMLSRKRIMVLAPEGADVTLGDAAAYAASRGVVAEGAREQLAIDFRTRLTPAIASRLDSNTVLYYQDQSVSGLVPLNATSDFNGAEPNSWDEVKRARREGNIDFLIVLNRMSINNSGGGDGSGTESIETSYSLLDLQGGKVVTSGRLSVPVGPANAVASYDRFARELTAKLPFLVTAVTGK